MLLDRILDQQKKKGGIVETVGKILLGSVDWMLGLYQWYPNQDGFYSRNEKTVLVQARQTLITIRGISNISEKLCIYVKKEEENKWITMSKLNNLGEKDVLVLAFLL